MNDLSPETVLMNVEVLIRKCEQYPERNREMLNILRRIVAEMLKRVDAVILRQAGEGGTY